MAIARRRFINGFIAFALIAVWLAPTPGVAQAAELTETYTVSVPSTDTNWTRSRQVPRFDPALGDLLEVTISMSGEVLSRMAVENLSTTSTCRATLAWGADLQVGLLPADGEPFFPYGTFQPADDRTAEELQPFDGVVDFTGDSGETYDSELDPSDPNYLPPAVGETDPPIVLTDAASLAEFTGTEPIALRMKADANTSVTGCGNIVQLITTKASTQLTVTYRYDSSPDIDIEKATNGEDADNPTGPQIPVGDAVDWTYVVTNTGNVALTDVTVVDDQGVAVTCPQDTLAISESMTCTGNGIAELGQYANTGTTEGTAPDGTVVTDSDPSHYFGLEPGIDIEKLTNGNDADGPNDPDVPGIAPGDPLTWTYVVTNTGDVAISEADVTVTDDVIGTITAIVDKGDGDDVLAPGEVWVYEATAPDGAADLSAPPPGTPIVNGCNPDQTDPANDRATYENIGTVTVPGAVDTDPSHYCNELPISVDIEKATNGNDADDPNGGDVPEIAPGDAVTWTYVVTNTGQVAINEGDVTVTDDVIGTITAIVDKGDGDDVLAPGEVWIYEATGTAVDLEAADPGVPVVDGCSQEGATDPRATYVNNGTVTVPGDSDSDPSHYCNETPPPGIDIEKLTNGFDADDPNGADVPEISPGDEAIWTYVVTNTGDVPFNEADVTVTDDVLGPITNIVVKGDGDDVLAPGEVWLYQTIGTAVNLGDPDPGVPIVSGCSNEGQETPRNAYENVGTVTVPGLTDSDPSHYCNPPEGEPDFPAIDIEKATNGEDADDPTGPFIAEGDPVTWTYVVTNTGTLPLTNVTVVDDRGVEVTCPQDTLAVSESMTCTGSGTAKVGQYANVGTTEGTAPGGTVVTDEDPSHYYGYKLYVWLDCEHGDLGCLGFAGQAPGEVEVVIDGVTFACDSSVKPGTNDHRFHCMIDSKLLNETVDVQIYVDGRLLWSGAGIPAWCEISEPVPAPDPGAGSGDAEEEKAVRTEEPKATRTDGDDDTDARP